MSRYDRELGRRSAILTDTFENKVVASFDIKDYDYSHDKMREACNNLWDKLDETENIKQKKELIA